MEKRFSKKILLQYLHYKAEHLQNEHKFDSDNGWSQVNKKGEEINRTYGEWVTLVDLIESIENNLLGVVKK